MGRSSWKPLFVGKDFLQQVENSILGEKFEKNNKIEKIKGIKEKKVHEIIAYNRGTVIRKSMIGLKIQVYNGIRFFPIELNAEMIGHCLGEFSPTRKKPIPKKKKKKK